MATDFRLKQRLPELTQKIVETYSEVGSISHLGYCSLPNHDAIIAATEALKEILYPGYRRRDGLHLGNVTYHVGDLIDSLHDKLTGQIARALCHDAGRSGNCTPKQREEFEGIGQAITLSLLGQLPDLRRQLALDVEAAYAGDPACKSLDEVIFC